MTDLFGEDIVIVMSGDPVPKGRPRFNRKTGATYTPEKTATYENRLAWAAQSVMRGRPLLTGALDVRIVSYRSVPVSKSKRWKADALLGAIRPTGRPDWDNLGKIVDALNRVVWADDSQIVDGRVQKFYSDQPRIEIFVRELIKLA